MKGPLPAGWVRATLGEVCTERPNQTGPNTDPFTYIDIGAIDTHTKRIVDPKVLGAESAPSRARQRLRPGDVLVSMTRPNLNAVAWVGDDLANAVGSTGFQVLRGAECSSKFLCYRVQCADFVDAMSSVTQGALYPAVRPRDIQSFSVAVPPKAEQHRIVAAIEEHLTKLDAAVAALERARANARRYRAALLHAAISGELSLSSPEGASLDPRLKEWQAGATPPDPEVPVPVPESWGIVSLDAIAARITSGSRDWSPYYDRGSCVFVLAQNVRPGHLDLRSVQLVDPPMGHRDRERSRIQRNDILMTIVGANTGDACRVDADLKDHFVCQSVALIRLRDPAWAPFLELYLTAEHDGRAVLDKYSYGQGRPHLSFDQLRGLPVPFPPTAVQERIVSVASGLTESVSRVEAEVERQLALAAKLRQSILKRAFEGKLVPQDPNDEPASALLDRIRSIGGTPGPTATPTRTPRRRTRKSS